MNVPNEKTANELKNNISRFLQDEVFPEIEALLERYVGDEIVRFDRIELTVEKADWQQLSQLKQNIRQAFSQQLEIEAATLASTEVWKAERMPLVARMSHDEVLVSTLLYFLETGNLPWFGKTEYWAELQDETVWLSLLENAGQRNQIRQLLAHKTSAFTRFLKQLSLPQIFAFVEACDVVKIANPKRFSVYLSEVPVIWKNQLLRYLLGLSVGETKPGLPELIRIWFATVFPLQPKLSLPRKIFRKQLLLYVEAESFTRLFEADEAVWREIEVNENIRPPLGNFFNLKNQSEVWNGPSSQKMDFKSTSTQNQNPEAGNTNSSLTSKTHDILVSNAGLILTIPFLRALFRRLNLLDQANELLSGKQVEAVQILHFIATGEENAPEFLLLFEKFLCGVPLGFPIQRESLLNDEIRRECYDMLQELIRQWPALKSTSPDGLRQLFLQRQGKLMETENRYRLVLERKAQDVLLERLPWNIAVLQLPFSKQLLFTEW